MRKKGLIFTLSASLILGVSALGLASCGGGNEPSVDSSKKIAISGADNGYIGDTIQLVANVFGLDETGVTWSSSNESVATVDENGLVTLVGVGSAGIKATSTSDTSVSSSQVQIYCYEKGTETKALSIVSMPTTTKYKTGATLSFDGLKVSGFTYYDGIKDANSEVEFELSDLTFSTAEGTSLTSNGTLSITVSLTGYTSVSFDVEVNTKITVKELYIKSAPTKTSYVIGDNEKATFSSSGLKVFQYVYEDGVRTSTKTISSSEYRLSLSEGYEFKNEGSYTVTVSSKTSGVASTSFNVIVYTRDTRVTDLITLMASSKNYQVEVLNNVGTTKDAKGFHYLRTYTANYYDEIEYQNTTDTSGNVVFSTTSIKDHFGYMPYFDESGKAVGLLSYGPEEGSSRLEGKRIISTSTTDWWDKADTLANKIETCFDVKSGNIPTITIGGKFLSIQVVQVDNDNDDGDYTIANYPLIKSFLQYCGWSNSLITIMTRFEVTFTGESGLSMKAYFGSYGTTEMKVTAVGDASRSDAERAYSNKSLTPDTTVNSEVQAIADKLKTTNMIRYDYTSDDGFSTTALDYYNENYFYNVKTKSGYFAKDGKIYSFSATTKKNVTTVTEDSVKEVSTDLTSIPEYVSSITSTSFNPYTSIGLQKIIGGTNITGTLNTFDTYSSFSSSSVICYQSYDDNTKLALENYCGLSGTGEEQVENGRTWFMAHYGTNEETQEVDKSIIEGVEVWDIAVTGGSASGLVRCFGSFGEASLSWLESYINAAE